MRAVAINRFGPPEMLSVRTVPIPEPEPDEILIRDDSAGVGVWDLGEVQGRIARFFKLEPKWPWVLGSEGAGKVVEVGEKVTRFREGDLVYGFNWATNSNSSADTD